MNGRLRSHHLQHHNRQVCWPISHTAKKQESSMGGALLMPILRKIDINSLDQTPSYPTCHFLLGCLTGTAERPAGFSHTVLVDRMITLGKDHLQPEGVLPNLSSTLCFQGTFMFGSSSQGGGHRKTRTFCVLAVSCLHLLLRPDLLHAQIGVKEQDRD